MKKRTMVSTVLFAFMVIATVAHANSDYRDDDYLSFRNDDYFDFRDSDDDLREQDYRSQRMKKINVCSPAKAMIVDLKDEIREKSAGQASQKIRNLRSKISNKRDSISNIKSELANAKAKKQQLKARLQQLTGNMAGLVQNINNQIAQADREIARGNGKIAHNQRKKEDCRGGFLGSFCRSKHRGRVKDARKDVKRATSKKSNLVAAKNNLPKEKRGLPAKIKQVSAQVKSHQASLATTKNAKPTIEQMTIRLNRLIERNENISFEIDQLQDSLMSAKMMFAKCRRMRRLAKAYPIIKKQASRFLEKPVLCEEVDSIVDMAQKPFQKMAISDAANIACQPDGF